MGMPLDALTLDQAVDIVFDGLAKGHGGTVLTPNVDILRQYRSSPELQRTFETTELLVTDGVPLIWASRLQGTPLPERITGTDMMVSTAGAAASRGVASVFLGGGRPGAAQRAADHLARCSRACGLPPTPATSNQDRWIPRSMDSSARSSRRNRTSSTSGSRS